jgi:hypothetical protein
MLGNPSAKSREGKQGKQELEQYPEYICIVLVWRRGRQDY